MLFTEFNMEDALEVRYEEGKTETRSEGPDSCRIESFVNNTKGAGPLTSIFIVSGRLLFSIS